MYRTSSVARHDTQGSLVVSTQVFQESVPTGEDSTIVAPEHFPGLYRMLRGLDPNFNTACAPMGYANNLFIQPRHPMSSEGNALLPAVLVRDGQQASGYPQPTMLSDLALLGHRIKTGPDGVREPDADGNVPVDNYNYFEWQPDEYNFYTSGRHYMPSDVRENGQDDPLEVFRFGPLGPLLVSYMTNARRAHIEQSIMASATHLPSAICRGKTPIINFNCEEIPAGVPLLLDVPTEEEMEHVVHGDRDPLFRRDLLSTNQQPHRFVPWVPCTQDQYTRRHGRTSGHVPDIVFVQMYFGVNLRDASPRESLQVLVGKPPGPACL